MSLELLARDVTTGPAVSKSSFLQPNGQGALCGWEKETVALGPIGADHLTFIQMCTYRYIANNNKHNGMVWYSRV